jgi:WD40 repeat protein
MNRQLTRRSALIVHLSVAFLFLCGSMISRAQQPKPTIDFSRDIFPILHNNCVACHSAQSKMGGLTLDSYDDLLKGGKNGPAIVPGKSSASRLALMLEGALQPKMPLSGELKPSEIAAIKAWIDSGAHNSEPQPGVEAPSTSRVPDIKPRVSLLPQVSSLAFSPDGLMLAIAGYKEVQILDNKRGSIARLQGPSDAVRSVAYSSDGRWLAAAGGAPGRSGEVVLWDTATGQPAHKLKGHRDYIYQVAFSGDSRLLATSSYDRSITIWEVASGREVRTLKDHTDAVYPVAFSPDGKLLASGAADRTVKVWEVASGNRLFTLSDALDVLYTLAFHPSGKQISAAGADKSIWTWDVTREAGTLLRSVIAHEDAIVHLVYSPDGKTVASAGADRLIKLWDTVKGAEIRMLEKQPDWPLALAFSPDGRQLAVGRYDGSVTIYDAATGRRLSEPIH